MSGPAAFSADFRSFFPIIECAALGRLLPSRCLIVLSGTSEVFPGFETDFRSFLGKSEIVPLPSSPMRLTHCLFETSEVGSVPTLRPAAFLPTSEVFSDKRMRRFVATPYIQVPDCLIRKFGSLPRIRRSSGVFRQCMFCGTIVCNRYF